MGAKHFVHYSFPRHMSQELLARRRDIMKQAAAKKGMDFHFVTAPDPMAEGGLPATQQFVLEDQPREIKKFGTETAFFSTNCGMQDPLIRSVLTNGGYVPEQCCPSPTHGYPDRARHRGAARQGRRHRVHQLREQADHRRARHDRALRHLARRPRA